MADNKKKTRSAGSKSSGAKKSSKSTSAKGRKTGSRSSGSRSEAKNRSRERVKEAPVREEVPEEGYSFAQEAGILILLCICVLLFLSNFGVIGAFGNATAAFLFGIFGSAAYVFPFALFFTVVMLVANHVNNESIVKAIMIWVTYLIVAMFFAMAWSGDFETRKSSFNGDAYFRYGMESRRGGGFIPGHLYELMSNLLGQFGTVIIMITLLVICVGVLTGRSIIRFIRESTREAADTLVEGIEMHQEEVRHERRERRRSEGVYPGRPAPTGDTISKLKLEPEEEQQSDDMKELTPEEVEQLDERERDIEDRFGAPDEEPGISIPGSSRKVPPNVVKMPVIQPEPVQMEESPEEEPDDIFEDDIIEEEPAPVIVPKKPAKAEEPREVPSRSRRSVASSKIPDGVSINNDEVSDYKLPPVSILSAGKRQKNSSKKEQEETSRRLQETLANFGVNVNITNVSQGPTVTRYEIQPEAGIKVSRIVSLTDDIKLALAAESIRIEAPIPGKSAIGIEVPNAESTPVMLRDLIESDEFRNSKSKISFAVGKDISGRPVIFDIAKMPHVLIAGATGAGKSVCINTIIMSILYKARPDEVKLMMIDPKIVELSIYNGIPHLLTNVVTDPQNAAGALNWSVIEMDRRYELFAEHAVRNLKGYNQWAEKNNEPLMPQIVIIVDELADLMMTAKSDVETAIVRLAQKARAAGMHLIIATQRPSVDVITGLIKANMPSRVAFTVTSGTDSRTILDMVGAERLLGKGDMLFHPVGAPKPSRVQGAFVSDEEVEAVAEFVRAQKKEDDGSEDIGEAIKANAASSGQGQSKSGSSQISGGADDEDEIFMQAAEFAVNLDKETVSIGLLQRKFRLGFNRAARIMDQLTDEGIVGEEMGTKGRKIVMTPEQFETFKEERA